MARSLRFIRPLVVACVAASLVAGAIGAADVPLASAGGIQTQRLGGADRFATAAKIALAASRASTVVLASGRTYADALSGAFLAGLSGAAMLLTEPDSLPPATSSAIATLRAKRVIVLGGTQAVSDDVVMQLAALPEPPAVNRLAGATRYDTMQAVVEDGGAGGAVVGLVAGKRTAIVASGANFPDALAASGAAYRAHLPIVLTEPDGLSAQAANALGALGIEQVVIMGGDAAVSGAVELALAHTGMTTIERFAGADRTDTAAQFARWAVAALSFSSSQVLLARGDDFADALAGAQAGAPTTSGAPPTSGAAPASGAPASSAAPTTNAPTTNAPTTSAAPGANAPTTSAAPTSASRQGQAGVPLLLTSAPDELGTFTAHFLASAGSALSGITALGAAGAVSDEVLSNAANAADPGGAPTTGAPGESTTTAAGDAGGTTAPGSATSAPQAPATTAASAPTTTTSTVPPRPPFAGPTLIGVTPAPPNRAVFRFSEVINPADAQPGQFIMDDDQGNEFYAATINAGPAANEVTVAYNGQGIPDTDSSVVRRFAVAGGAVSRATAPPIMNPEGDLPGDAVPGRASLESVTRVAGMANRFVFAFDESVTPSLPAYFRVYRASDGFRWTGSTTTPQDPTHILVEFDPVGTTALDASAAPSVTIGAVTNDDPGDGRHATWGAVHPPDGTPNTVGSVDIT